MHFVETLGSKSKQQKNKNFNEIAIFDIHQCHLQRLLQPLLKILQIIRDSILA